MAIDLSALDVSLEALEQVAPPAPAPAKPSGKPLMLCVADIDEDPNQPRKEFTDEAMAEMVASIKARGVKSPVSVRTHPTDASRWMLNYGARRYRGSLEAGNAEIPAFVDEEHSDYDQVIENLQRENLTPMEMALFIKRKIKEGEKPATIAKKLGKDRSVVTHHQALVDAPAVIEGAYSSGRCTSPKTLYNLRSLYEKYPNEVTAWVEGDVEITRATVAMIADELRSGGKAKQATGISSGEPSVGHDQHKGGGSEEGSSEGSDGEDGEGNGTAFEKLPYHNPENEKSAPEPKIDDPNKIKKPVLLVEFDDRPAMVMLNRRPSASGLVRIKYEDNGEEIEVDAWRCKINCLIEASA